MQYKGLNRVEALRRVNGNKNWVNHRLYRLMYDEDLYITAYEKLKSKPGNMTPGPDGTTLDGFSLKTIHNLVKKMRSESFKFSRARRIYIPKKSGGTRPLGIAPPNDKIVQEVIRNILEAIYDSDKGPTFSDLSHGFRPGRSCHTALKQISRQWTGITWIIEGDIKGFFDNINHELLIDILSKRIQDSRFLNLIRKALNAGYLEFKEPIDSELGTPQGSVLSPILANIYLHEFDEFIGKIIKKKTKGIKRKTNLEYKRIQSAILNRRKRIAGEDDEGKALLLEEIKNLEKRRRATPSYDPKDKGFIRVKYVRYADDWMVGINGPKNLAVLLREKIRYYLEKTLKLELSMEKTHIRHAKSEESFFLGTRILIGHKGKGKITNITTKDGRNYKRRSSGWIPVLKAPVRLLVNRLHIKGFCDKKGFPLQMNPWSVLDDDQIIHMYNAVLWGIVNYYSFAFNYADLSRVQYILKFSAAKTLATKHKSSVKKVFAKYGNTLKVVNLKGKEVSLKLVTDWRAKTYRFLINVDRPKILDFQREIRSRSKLGKDCVICGGWHDVVMHHVRSIKKMGQKVHGFNRILRAINRKQIPCCAKCHWAIHNGYYDGIALSSFQDVKTARA